MARYRGPVEKIERRFGVSLNMKGERRLAGKSALEKRPFAPGQHGQRRKKVSEYGLQLNEKQKAKFMYGVSEKQLRALFAEAKRRTGNTGTNLVMLLEQRLDNVVYRMGFASTRRFARQFVNHGHILVDGKPDIHRGQEGRHVLVALLPKMRHVARVRSTITTTAGKEEPDISSPR